jgi:hypothetical protein
MQNADIDYVQCAQQQEERCQQLSQIYQFINQYPAEIRENPYFMRARSLSEAAIDSIVQGILDVNANQMNMIDLATNIKEITNQNQGVSTTAHTAV